MVIFEKLENFKLQNTIELNHSNCSSSYYFHADLIFGAPEYINYFYTHCKYDYFLKPFSKMIFTKTLLRNCKNLQMT